MRRRTTATTTIAALVLTLAAGTASTAATTDPPDTVDLLPGVDLHGNTTYAQAEFGSDALYALVAEGIAPEDPTFIESDLYTRSLEESDGSVALGASTFVAHASGYAMAEHEGTLAYLRRDGRLALRAPDGSETTPAWGADENFLTSGPHDMNADWIAVFQGVIYSRSTGQAYDLTSLPLPDGAPDVQGVDGIALGDDYVTWSMWGYEELGGPQLSAVYVVGLGPSGPVGPVTMLEQSNNVPGVSALGFFGGKLAWRGLDEATGATVALHVATPPAFDSVTEYLPDASNPDVIYWPAGDRIVGEAWSMYGDPVGLTSIDLSAPDLDEYSATLPGASNTLSSDGSLVAYSDGSSENLYLTDLKGRTFTDAQPPSEPVVSAVEPPSGSVLGGTTVTVRGTGFTGATQVTFGGTPGTNLQVVSPTKLTVRTPAGAAGTVAVVVTTPAGASGAAADATFAYTELVTQTPLRGIADWSVPAGAVRCQQVAGTNGVPDEATGVIVNVTTVHPTGPGYVVVYPDTAGNGATVPPNSSTVNFEPGADVANGAFVALPDNGKICYSTRGAPNAGVLVDVTGYTLDGSGIITQPSTRLLDTRAGASHVGQVTGPVNGHQVYTVDVAGQAGVPEDATAVLLNVTVAGVSTLGNLRVFPGGQDVPGTSVLNYAAGREKANGSIVALGPDGTISFWSDTAGTVQVILDVVGYVEAGSSYHGIAPERVMDTRGGGLRVGPIAGPLTSGRVYSLPLAGVDPVPADATAVVLNVTAIGPTSIGNLRVYPDSDGTGTTPPPAASSINYIPGRDIPNQVVVALPANGQVNFYNDGAGGGTIHLAVDVAGYITTPQGR